jgi:gliding motility-associated-like protein
MLIANADHVKTPWVPSVDISIMNNDYDSKNDFDKTTITVVDPPVYGSVVVNLNGSVTYTPTNKVSSVDKFIYKICDHAGLCDTALVTVKMTEGLIWVPEAISVNGDGINDYFVIRGLENYPNSALTIYTRSGQLVYKSDNYLNDWAGKSLESTIKDNILLPTGTYYYVLHLGGTDRYIKGFVYLLY